MTIDEFQELESLANNLKEKASRAKGAVDQLHKRLKKEFGCSSLKEAEALLAKRNQKEKSLEEQYQQAIRPIKKWKRKVVE